MSKVYGIKLQNLILGVACGVELHRGNRAPLFRLLGFAKPELLGRSGGWQNRID
jgi:hypothetical protein